MTLGRVLQDHFSKYVAPRVFNLNQLLRPARRRPVAFFNEGLCFRVESEGWSDTQKQRWIIERLRYVVRHAGQTTPHYSAVFEKIGFDPTIDFDFDAFSALPSLDRETILKSGRQLLPRNVAESDLQKNSSGGSSGEPVTIWMGPQEIGWRLSASRFFMDKLAITPGSRIAYLWGHNLDPGYKPSLTSKALFYARNERWFDCFRISDESLLQYHRDMDEFQPDCIVAYASALALFASVLKENGIVPRYPRQCILTGAEKLFAFQREITEQVFRRPVFERYGSRDGGVVGYQLPDSGPEGFIVDWSNVLVEPETPEPESPILITKLHADGMPMIRYRIGDLGTFPVGSRPGYPVMRLRSVVGRMADHIRLSNGDRVHGNQFPHLFKDFPIREFLVVQSEDYSLEVKIVPQKEFGPVDLESLRKIIESNLPGLPVEILMVECIPKTLANKWRPVVSRVVGHRGSTP